MTDLDLDAGVTPRAMADANETVRRLRLEATWVKSDQRLAEIERVKASEALAALDSERAEYEAKRPQLIADAEAKLDVANAEVARLKVAIADAPARVNRLILRDEIAWTAAGYAGQGQPVDEIISLAIAALRDRDALDGSDDPLTAAWEAAACLGDQAAIEFKRLALGATDAKYAAIEASDDLQRMLVQAEVSARHARIAVDNQMSERAWYGYDAAAKADAAATAKAQATKIALDDLAARLAHAEAALAALVEADAPLSAADNADFTMFKVTVEHEAYGGNENLAVCALDYEAPFDEDDDGGEDVDEDDPRVDCVRVALRTAYAFLERLGAIRCDGVAGADSNAATFWLAIEGGGWRPAGMPKGEKSFELGGYDTPLPGIKGARLKVRIVWRPVLPSEAYAAIALRHEGGNVGWWGGDPPDETMLTHPCENRRSWLYGISQWPEDMDPRLKRLAKLNNDVAAYMSCLNLLAIDDAEWAVEARLAYGALTLLVGDGGAGKSTWAHELFAATNAEEGSKEWAGGKVHARVAGMAGEEDTPHQLMRRQERFSHAWGHEVDGPVFQDSGPDSFPALLEWMGRLPDYSVVTIDHASAFTDGDLTQSHVAASFLGPLNKIAKRKKLAVLLLHHFTKSAPREAERMAQAIAGSATVKNLVRVVLSLTELADGRRSVTVVKSNIDGLWLGKNESQIFQSDPQNWRLLPVVPEAAATSPTHGPGGAVDEATAELVFAAVARLNREGIEVHKSGRNDLHSLRLPELEGIGRDRLRIAIDRLILAGLLGRSEHGLVAHISTEICGRRMQA